MILLIAVIIGLAGTLVRARLTHRTLKLPHLNWEWLVFIAVLPQLLVFQIPYSARLVPEEIIPAVQILSMAGLVVFAFINLLKPGFGALCIGLACNFIVIVVNGGWMPISIETLHRMSPSRPEDIWMIGSRLGFTKDRIMAASDINLIWLTDRFTLPQGFPQNVAFSVGDIFIAFGVIFLLWSLSRKEKRRKNDTHTIVTDRNSGNTSSDYRSTSLDQG